METGRTRRRRRQLGLEAPLKEHLALQIANTIAISLYQNSQGSGSHGLLGGKQGLLARKLRLAEQNVANMAAYLRSRKSESTEVVASPVNVASCAGNRIHCVICLDAEMDAVSQALPCGHIFHAHCIKQWLIYRRECPVDRRSVD